ncbi:MAG: thiamine phosphate synthase [Dehalococcoidales bacterium]|nr:thiamine phosphate synthase [Dehalococcoidales bacterium]
MKTPGPVPPQLLRIVDANTNRIGEGLRFLEEIARMVLNDSGLTGQLKNLRHELVRSDLPFQKQLLQARDAAGDVGANLEVPADKQRDLPSAIVANSRRVQESLRVMEELGKIPGLPPNAANFQQARFALYTVEKTLLSRLLRQDKAKKISGLYVVIDIPSSKKDKPVEVARQAIRGGAGIIQLRDKSVAKKELLPVAQSVKDLCAGHDVLFIINDCLDLALAVDADGMHTGHEDLPVDVVRRLLPIDKLLGVTVSTVEQAKAAQNDGADYIAVDNLETLREIRQAISLPLVATAVSPDNLDEVLAAGADSIAITVAGLSARNIAETCRDIAERFKNGTDR